MIKVYIPFCEIATIFSIFSKYIVDISRIPKYSLSVSRFSKNGGDISCLIGKRYKNT